MFWRNLESDDRCQASLEASAVTRHTPVFLVEALRYLGASPERNFLDLTLGGGGHTEALLRATSPGGRVLAVDRDEKALGRTRSRLESFSGRVQFLKEELQNSRQILKAAKFEIDGALIDCGISSDQLDEPDRGFSFLREGPLDMRMDQDSTLTAAEILASWNERDLADLFYSFGEERHSRRIARVIVEGRRRNPLRTTTELAAIVERCIPRPKGPVRIHPATRVFQALRIAVNSELDQLTQGLRGLLAGMKMGARLVVITFHSLEDRIVKQAFRQAATEGAGRLLTKKPIVPTDEEMRDNPRSRSAKLRALEIVGGLA